MKELDPFIFLAVFQEMLGVWLWVGLVFALSVLVGVVRLIRIERRFHARRFLLSEFIGLAGGGLALVVMALVSSSGFTDAAGPADWILIVMVYAAGMVSTTITVYTMLGLRATQLIAATPQSS